MGGAEAASKQANKQTNDRLWSAAAGTHTDAVSVRFDAAVRPGDCTTLGPNEQ